MGVNEFNRDIDYYRFQVVTGLTTHKGYIYSSNKKLQSGDTLPATSVRNRNYHFKVVLTRQVTMNWFEYYDLPGRN